LNLKKVKDWVYKDGVPILTNDEIEGYALEFIKKYSPISINRYEKIPIIEILRRFVEDKKVSLEIVDLGEKDGYKVLGKTLLKENKILIDSNLYCNVEKNFILRRTIAHELGHWIFHKYKKIKSTSKEINENIEEDNNFEYRLINGEEVKVFIKDRELFKNYKKALKTPLDFAEHQAKFFAASVLLPKNVLLGVLALYQKNERGLARNISYIYLNDEPSSMREFYDTLDYLKKYFDVSKVSIEYRLTYLERIIDTRSKSKYNAQNLEKILQSF